MWSNHHAYMFQKNRLKIQIERGQTTVPALLDFAIQAAVASL